MAEIMWHRRETRRQTENTNISLTDGKNPAYSPFTQFWNQFEETNDLLTRRFGQERRKRRYYPISGLFNSKRAHHEGRTKATGNKGYVWP